MPRYFFHVYDDVVARDEEGLVLPDLEAARQAAIEGARSLMAGQVKDGRLMLSHRIEVEDEEGCRVLTLGFDEALAVVR